MTLFVCLFVCLLFLCSFSFAFHGFYSFLRLVLLLSCIILNNSNPLRPSDESIFETSRRRTGDAIFTNFSAQSDGTDAAKSAHVSRIRREMAARMRAVKSLSLATRSTGERGPDDTIQRDDDCVEEERVEIPFILTRHPEEEALLAACNSRLAVLRSDIQKAEEALDRAGVYGLWSTFQEFCVSRAIRRLSSSRRVALEHIGMRVCCTIFVFFSFALASSSHGLFQDLRELLLTFTFRCCFYFTYLELTAQVLPHHACVLTFVFRADRWLHMFNDPLVHVLSEYESSINELATAQELRVTAANEVLASMKLIAGSFSFCHVPSHNHRMLTSHTFTTCLLQNLPARAATLFCQFASKFKVPFFFDFLRIFSCLWFLDIYCDIV